MQSQPDHLPQKDAGEDFPLRLGVDMRLVVALATRRSAGRQDDGVDVRAAQQDGIQGSGHGNGHREDVYKRQALS